MERVREVGCRPVSQKSSLATLGLLLDGYISNFFAGVTVHSKYHIFLA